MTLAGPINGIVRAAEAAPGSAAIVVEDKTWTYSELLRELRRWAGALAMRGLGPGGIVAATSQDQVALRLIRWAANYLGAVEALIDPHCGPAEHAARLAVVRPDLILTDADIPALRADAVGAEGPESASIDLSTPARLLFTSGSSGAPRAVLQLAGQLDSAARSNAVTRGMCVHDRLLCVLPPYHAAGSLFEDTIVWLGGCLLLPGRGGPGRLGAALRSGSPTVMTAVPAILVQLEKDGDLPALGGLRLLNYAGDLLDSQLLRRVLEQTRGEVTRGYGLTEAGPLVSVLSAAAHRGAVLPEPAELGQPADGVEVRVDPRTSELMVRSGHVMAGYLHDPDATRHRLRDGWLRTGDLVELGPSGIRLVGRRSNLIRSGSEWIALEQIERCLRSFPTVGDVVAVAVPHPQWTQRPVAYLEQTELINSEMLWAHVAANLTRYATPDWIEVVDALPRLGSGKVDRVGLAARAAIGPRSTAWHRPITQTTPSEG